MANVQFLWNSVSDLGTANGGLWSASLPLANLLDKHPKKLARSSNALITSTTFLIDLGAAMSLQAFAFVNHNFSDASTFRIKAGPNADGSGALIDSGSVDGLAVGAANVPPGGWITYYVNATSQSCRYILVTITDTANTAGYVQIGHFMAGVPFVPGINIAVGVAFELMDDSKESRAVAGDRFVDVRPRRRRLRGRLDFLTETETFAAGSITDLLEAGIDGAILVIVDSTDSDILKSRRTLYGSLASPEPIDYARNGTAPYSWPFTIDEWT